MNLTWPSRKARFDPPSWRVYCLSVNAAEGVTVTEEMIRATGARPEHTDRFINYPRSIRGVEVAIFFRQIGPDRFKVGFRSKGTIDVGALARELGGGGHHNAAGAVVEGSITSVRDLVFTRVGALLKACR